MYHICYFVILFLYSPLVHAERLKESGRYYLVMQEQILERLRELKAKSKSTKSQITQLDSYCKDMTYVSEYAVATIARMRAKRERLEDRLNSIDKQRQALHLQLAEIREGLTSLSEEAGFVSVDKAK